MWVQLFLWIATTLLTDYFREPLPEVTASGLGDFKIPTATEGRFVPLAFGTNVIQGPNVTWYGDFEAVERTVETGLVFKKDEGIGFTYYLGMQMGLIRGRTTGIKRIWIGDDVVWDYLIDNGGAVSDTCDIDRDDLFGGRDSGGGFQGRVKLYDGSPTQGQSDYLKYKRRYISDSPLISPQFTAEERFTNLPNFRGFSYVTISNIEETRRVGPFGVLQVTTPAETKGANIGESNQMRHMKFEIQTWSTVAEGGLGDDLGLGNDHHFIGEDVNPICLAYDVFTNKDWGRGFSASDINLTSFKAAAETIYDEGLGFSIVIDQVQKAADLIDTIEQHIDGYIGPNPLTGLMEVILARQDYVKASEFQANATNIKSVKKYSRGEYNQTFNEVRVQYTDRAKDYKDNYAPAQDLANLIIQGRPRSKTMRYSGVHTAEIANKIVWRQIKGLAVALATATIEIDRTAWQLQPGKVVVVTDAEVGISDVAFRIIQMRHGDPQNATILLDVVEDVFGNEPVGFVDPPESEFIPPSSQAFALLQSQQMAMEAPYIMTRNDPDLPDVYPRLYVAAQHNDTILSFEVNVDQSVAASPTGFDVYEPNLSGLSMTVGVLKNSLTGWQDGNGTFTIAVDPFNGNFENLIGQQFPGGVGSLTGVCVINPNQANEEWIITQNIDWVTESPIVGAIQLESTYRAALDSAMQSHAAGEPVWFVWTGSAGMILEKQWDLSNTLDTKLLPITQTSRVNLTDSPEPPSALPVVIDSDARYAKPLLPIALSINDTNFPTTQVDLDSSRNNTSLSPSAFIGAEVAPTFRIFRVENVIWQVEALNSVGGIPTATNFTNDSLTFSWWFYNTDAGGLNSPMQRTDAILSAEDIPVTGPNTPFAILKSALVASIDVNEFNARLEIETKQMPFDIIGSPATNRVSREVMIFDFVCTGLFVIDPDDIVINMSFDGANGVVGAVDVSKYLYPVAALGEGVISTAQSVFGGSSLLLQDPNNRTNAGGGGFMLDMSAPLVARSPMPDFASESWTIEFRLWQTSNSAFTIGGVSDELNDDRVFLLDYSAGRFRIWYSTAGTSWNATANINNTTAWTPSPATGAWYAIAIVKKQTSATTFTMSLFIDGELFESRDFVATLHSAPLAPFAIGSDDPLDTLGGNGNDTYIDEFRATMLPLYSATYTPETNVFESHWEKYSLIASFDPYDGPNDETFFAGGLRDMSLWGETIHTGQEFTPTQDSTVDRPTTGPELHPAPPWWGSPESDVWTLWCGGENTTSRDLADGAWVGSTSGSVESPQDWEQFEFGTGDWTMEITFKFFAPSNKSPTAESPDGYCLFSKYNRPQGNSTQWSWYFTQNGGLVFATWPTSGTIADVDQHLIEFTPDDSLSPGPAKDTQWHHAAMSREGRRLTMWIDGYMIGTDAEFFETTEILFNSSLSPVGIGRYYDASVASRVRAFHGWLLEPRITKGEAVYTYSAPFSPDQSLTSPNLWETSPLGAQQFAPPSDFFPRPRSDLPLDTFPDWDTHVKFQTSWEGGPGSPGLTPVDDGPQARTITLVGGASLDTTTKKYGTASLRVGPTASPEGYATLPDSIDWDIDNDDFTMETCVAFASIPSASPEQFATFFGQWNLSGDDRVWRFGYHGANGLTFEQTTSGTAATLYSRSVPWTPVVESPARFYHVAVTRRDKFLYFFVDGLLIGTQQLRINGSDNVISLFSIGASLNGSTPVDVLDGWLDDTKITLGAPVYTRDFTPQQHYFQDTVMLSGADTRYIRTNGYENQAYGAQGTENGNTGGWVFQGDDTKFAELGHYYAESYPLALKVLGTSSNQHLEYDDNADFVLGSDEFTIEGWLKQSALNDRPVVAQSLTTGSQRSWIVRWNGASGVFRFDVSSNGSTETSIDWVLPPSPTLALADYAHFAIVRDNSSSPELFRAFVDGVELIPVSPDLTSASGFTFHNSTGDLTVGGYPGATSFAGVLEDIRLTKRCLYRGNFTPVNAKFPRI